MNDEMRNQVRYVIPLMLLRLQAFIVQSIRELLISPLLEHFCCGFPVFAFLFDLFVHFVPVDDVDALGQDILGRDVCLSTALITC